MTIKTTPLNRGLQIAAIVAGFLLGATAGAVDPLGYYQRADIEVENEERAAFDFVPEHLESHPVFGRVEETSAGVLKEIAEVSFSDVVDGGLPEEAAEWGERVIGGQSVFVRTVIPSGMGIGADAHWLSRDYRDHMLFACDRLTALNPGPNHMGHDANLADRLRESQREVVGCAEDADSGDTVVFLRRSGEVL